MADQIKTHPATPEYRDGWDRIFGKRGATRMEKISAEILNRAFNSREIQGDLVVHPDRAQLAQTLVRDWCVVTKDNRLVNPDDWRVETPSMRT